MPKGAKYRRIFFFLPRWSPLDGTSGGVLRGGKLAGNLSRRWRRRATTTNGLFPQGTLVLSHGRPEEFSRTSRRPLPGRKAKSPRPASVVDKGAGAVVGSWRAEYLRTVRAPERARLSNPGCPLAWAQRGAGIGAGSADAECGGFELGDRRTTRAKARFKLNRDGKQETCLAPGTSFGNRMVLFDPIRPYSRRAVPRGAGKISSPKPAPIHLESPRILLGGPVKL